MNPLSTEETLDRHILVTAVWIAFGFVAVVLFGHGFGGGGALFIASGSAGVLAAFVGHIIVNVVYATRFSPRELALGLVFYGVALIAFGVATLITPGFAARHFVPLSISFLAVGAAILFYMITHFGVRRVFTEFDIIRDFSPTDDRDTSADPGETR